MKKINQKRENRFPFMHRFLTGMIIALSLTLTAFEWTTVTTTYFDPNCDDCAEVLIEDDEILPPITYTPEKTKKPKPIENTTQIEVVEEILKEEVKKEEEIKVVDKTIVDNSDQLTLIDLTLYGNETDSNFEIDENKIHVNVEIFAHYNDCSNLRGEELKECSLVSLQNEIKDRFVISRHLKDIGGKQAVLMSFVVNKEGEIESIEVLDSSSRAMEKDAIKAIKRLPKLNPAMQQGRAVSLRLKIPIIALI